ncbi:amidohydrolase family protein [Streptomyces sp. NPDC012769]|uniref:N-acyl-D-amino-acid deacylase family protein n=1 Tax=Streptomyces sp. NPDC012769 TaxID=3364848 RepID=UPI0036CEFE91
MDLVLRDAEVVDGTGAPSYRADVALADGRIAAIVKEGAAAGCQRPTARRVVDAEGLALSPGFIDMHAHSDLALLRDPDHSAKAAQGVTLEVLGQDGLSYAPVDDRTLDEVRRAITGWNGGAPGDTSVDFDWRTVGEYLDRLDRGVAVNAAYLVPQGTVRMHAVGWEDRPATEAELNHMRRLVAEGLEQGAVGMSSGLTYTPGMYAPDAELTELCRVVARYGGYYCPHHRSYGAGALEAYEEMVRLTRDAGCALHLAHATMNFGVNEGRAPELLALLDEALAGGSDISLDTYPYTPGCTTLVAVLPSWAHEGGPEVLLARLRDDATAERIRHHLEEVGSDGCHGVPVEWDTLEVSGVTDPALAGFVGRRLADWPTARRLLVEDRLGSTVLQHVGHEENVRAIMRHRVHTGGSDGILQGAKPHPRAYGTFPEYLGRYVREEGVLSLEECVAHLTARPAARLRLPDRGLVREGYVADLVLFDPATVAAGSTYDSPRTLPVGIPHVLVDGRFVIEDGRRTDALPGRSVRRTPRP